MGLRSWEVGFGFFYIPSRDDDVTMDVIAIPGYGDGDAMDGWMRSDGQMHVDIAVSELNGFGLDWFAWLMA